MDLKLVSRDQLDMVRKYVDSTTPNGAKDISEKLWAGGAGKNKLPSFEAGTKTDNDITVVSDGNGIMHISGTSSAEALILFDLDENYTIPRSIGQGGNGCFFMFNTDAVLGCYLVFYDGSSLVDRWETDRVNRANGGYSVMGEKTINKIGVKVSSGVSVDMYISPMITDDGSETATDFEPYSKTSITLTDAMDIPPEELSLDFKPTQDLHGYDKPWAGGAGKNKLPYFTAEEENGIRLSYDNGAAVLNGTASANAFFDLTNLNLTSGTYTFSANNTEVNNGVHVALREVGADSDFADLPMNDSDKYNIYQNVSIGQVTLYVLSGTQLTDFKLPLQIEVGDSKTDFEPYSNICPISGQNNATFEWTGKNLFDKKQTFAYNGFISSDGTLTSSYFWRTTDYQLIKSGTYTLSGALGEASGYYGICWYDNDKAYIGGFQKFDTAPQTVIIPSNAKYIRYCVNIEALNTFQLEQGSTATSYEPYYKAETEMQFGSTKYGGFCQFASGAIYSTFGVVDLGDLTWTKGPTSDTGKYRFYASISNNKESSISAPTSLSSHYSLVKSYATYTNLQNGYVLGSDGKIYMYLEDYNDYSESDFASAMSGVQIAYELATPTKTTRPVTPANIQRFNKGVNHITANGEQINIRYQPINVIGECKKYTDDKVDTKVDKVSGKGLSTNDYTTAEKDKLAGIASGAEANVQPDWNQSSTTANDFIKNKPSSMPASDVYAWAKAATKPSYSASEVGLGNVGNFKAVSTVANQGLSDTEKANARDNIGAASDSLVTTSVKGLMSPDDKNTLNVLNARHKIRVISAQNSYNSSTGKSTVTFTLNPNNLDGYGKFYRVSSMDSTGFGCMFTFHCFVGGLNISSDKISPNCTMTTSGNPETGLVVTLVSAEGVGYSGQFRVKIETINY